MRADAVQQQDDERHDDQDHPRAVLEFGDRRDRQDDARHDGAHPIDGDRDFPPAWP